MNKKNIVAAIVFLHFVTLVHCYSYFKSKIPNGQHVIDPCGNDVIWEGVGHKSRYGKGPLNPFGEDWSQSKHWPSVCSLDSDNDGRTNGEELGDPNCTWTEESNASLSRDTITHPGICEPLESANCTEINRWLSCNTTTVTCNETMAPDVKKLELRLNNAEVPAEVTTYSCMVYDVPRNGTYDIIAAKPIIGNKHVIHHMIIFGCMTKDLKKDVKPNQLVPHCFMADRSGCKSMVAAFGLWDPDVDAFCLPPDIGVRIGQGGYEQLMIQFHWNNVDKASGMTDTSGVEIFYTPVLRKENSGMLLFGQMKIFLPPKKENVTVSGGCQPSCSHHRMRGPVKVIESFHHMHMFGVSQKIEILRNGTKMYTLSDEKDFNYNVPKFYRYYDKPIEIERGDYIRTTCTYNSMKADTPIKFGVGTNDEMCFGFIRFYPLSNLPLEEGGCSEFGTVPLCKVHTPTHYTIDGCDVKSVLTHHSVNPNNSLLSDLVRHCNSTDTCTRECSAVQMKMMKDPCFQNDIGLYVKYLLSHWRKWDGVHIMRRLLGRKTCSDTMVTTPRNGSANLGQLEHLMYLLLSISVVIINIRQRL